MCLLVSEYLLSIWRSDLLSQFSDSLEYVYNLSILGVCKTLHLFLFKENKNSVSLKWTSKTFPMTPGFFPATKIFNWRLWQMLLSKWLSFWKIQAVEKLSTPPGTPPPPSRMCNSELGDLISAQLWPRYNSRHLLHPFRRKLLREFLQDY